MFPTAFRSTKSPAPNSLTQHLGYNAERVSVDIRLTGWSLLPDILPASLVASASSVHYGLG